VSLVSFSIILWQLSGPIPIFGMEIPRAMTFIVYLYVIIVSVIVFRIGRPSTPQSPRHFRLPVDQLIV